MSGEFNPSLVADRFSVFVGSLNLILTAPQTVMCFYAPFLLESLGFPCEAATVPPGPLTMRGW